MSTPAIKKPSVDETRIGIHSATQPLSGIARVDATAAVNGLGHGAFVRKEDTERRKA